MMVVKHALLRLRRYKNTAHKEAVRELAIRMADLIEIDKTTVTYTPEKFLEKLLLDYIVLNSLMDYLIAVVGAFLAGAINTLAGNGSAITLTVLMDGTWVCRLTLPTVPTGWASRLRGWRGPTHLPGLAALIWSRMRNEICGASSLSVFWARPQGQWYRCIPATRCTVASSATCSS